MLRNLTIRVLECNSLDSVVLCTDARTYTKTFKNLEGNNLQLVDLGDFNDSALLVDGSLVLRAAIEPIRCCEG